MTKSYLDMLAVGEMRVDEALWGEGAEPIILEFLQNEYDPKTMPLLAAADVKDREGVWLLGWEDDGTDWPNLLVYLFGEDYRDQQMARIKLRKQLDAASDGRFGLGFQR
jgi:hypothetical protein